MKKGTPVEKGWPTYLGPDDYDFTAVPEHEEQGCAYYEYARESPSITALVEAGKALKEGFDTEAQRAAEVYNYTLRKFRTGVNRKDFKDRILSGSLDPYLRNYKSFPLVSFQKLPPEDKVSAFHFGPLMEDLFQTVTFEHYPPLVLYEPPDWNLLNSPTPEGLKLDDLKAKFYHPLPNNLVSGILLDASISKGRYGATTTRGVVRSIQTRSGSPP
jgi:hypothetical protein